MSARRIRLRDPQPTKRHAQRVQPQHGEDARGKAPGHRACQIGSTPLSLALLGADVEVSARARGPSRRR